MEQATTIPNFTPDTIKVMALEANLNLAIQIIKDIAYHNRHEDAEYLKLVDEFIMVNTKFLKDDF